MPDYEEIKSKVTPRTRKLLEQGIPATTTEPEEDKGYWQETFEEFKAPFTRPDIPLWKRGLAAFAAPFTAIGEGLIKPAAAIVSSPFTPSTGGTEGDSWFERELKEYKAWDDPNWKFVGVKGALEFLPWLAVPGVGIAARGTGIAGQV